MEILNIQETTIAKVGTGHIFKLIFMFYFHCYFCAQEGFASVSCGSGPGEKDADSAAALKTLLSRWREKVFVMLVQQKLLQIQDSRTKLDASRKVR